MTTFKNWADYFDDRAERFKDPRDIAEIYINNNPADGRFLADEGRKIASLFQPIPGSRIVDLGCCAGVCLEFLKPYFASAVGVDMAAKALEKAQKNYPDCRFICDDITRLDSFPDHSEKYILTYGVLHFLGSEEKIADYLATVARVADTGGRVVVIRIPNKEFYEAYQAYRRNRVITRKVETHSHLSWVWTDEAFLRRHTRAHFDLVVIRPPSSLDMPFQAFFDVVLIRR